MRDGNDLSEDDIVQSEGRLWRVAEKTTVITLTLRELCDSLTTPLVKTLEGDPSEAKFSPLNLRRLDPESVPGEPE